MARIVCGSLQRTARAVCGSLQGMARAVCGTLPTGFIVGLVQRDGEGSGLDPNFVHQLRLSKEHHEWLNVNAPLHSEACALI